MFSVSCVLPRDRLYTIEKKLYSYYVFVYLYLCIFPISIQMVTYYTHWLCLAFSQCVLEKDPSPSTSSFFVLLYDRTVVCLERPLHVFNWPPPDGCAGYFHSS